MNFTLHKYFWHIRMMECNKRRISFIDCSALELVLLLLASILLVEHSYVRVLPVSCLSCLIVGYMCVWETKPVMFTDMRGSDKTSPRQLKQCRQDGANATRTHFCHHTSFNKLVNKKKKKNQQPLLVIVLHFRF